MSSNTSNAHYSLFKGEPGVRKSTQALSYPLPQYWFSFDQKMNTLRLPMQKWGIDPKSISYDDYDDWNRCKLKLEAFQTNFPFKTLVIDSITSIGDATLRQSRMMKQGTTRSSGAAAGKRVGGIDVNELEDYSAEAAALMEMIALTKMIHKFHKVDVILIAHVIRTEEKNLNGITNVSRSIVTAAKKPAAKIPAYCDEIYHFGVESEIDISKGAKYSILTSHIGDDYARTSLELPTKILLEDQPLYTTHILPAINKQNNQPQTTTQGF